MKICVINTGEPLYRTPVFSLMLKELDCDFLMGMNSSPSIKALDYSVFKGRAVRAKTLEIGKIRYQIGALKRLFQKYDAYIISGSVHYVNTYLFLFLAKLFPKKKVFVWTHGWYGKESKIERFIKKNFLLNLPSGGVFLYGYYAKKLMINEGFDKNNLFVIHNSLDYDKQLALRNSLQQGDVYKKHFGKSYPVLIMIGRLNLRKKLGMLIEAVSILANKGEQYNVVLIGDGEDRHSLEQMCAEHNLTNQVWFYGACYDEKENAELLYNSDLCVVPGDIGLTAIHSMMFGVPVISHNNFPTQGPEFEAIKVGETGDFFERNNVDSLAATISKWFAEKKNKRDEVRQACFNEIDTQWTPAFQVKIMKEAIYGKTC